MSDLSTTLHALVGHRIPGGCDQCDDPHQTVKEHPQVPGVYMFTVVHDDDCPFLADYENKRNRAARSSNRKRPKSRRKRR
ncbi:hypothetical protein [Prescottella agglutinans]|uniref:Uncharacterized protein n=1 Tax=Prescottella agglutinans TaxID=1644129 RepID=A0ABT6MH56_9NOCA|nr:hypothetical protein [Prescottella agglutinans]MDH6283205.1 hypothetical protein [Prescottella agglutinans]